MRVELQEQAPEILAGLAPTFGAVLILGTDGAARALAGEGGRLWAESIKGPAVRMTLAPMAILLFLLGVDPLVIENDPFHLFDTTRFPTQIIWSSSWYMASYATRSVVGCSAVVVGGWVSVLGGFGICELLCIIANVGREFFDVLPQDILALDKVLPCGTCKETTRDLCLADEIIGVAGFPLLKLTGSIRSF